MTAAAFDLTARASGEPGDLGEGLERRASDRPATNDFDVYAPSAALAEATPAGDGVALRWADGVESWFLGWQLIDNCTHPSRMHPETREQLLDLSTLPDDFRPVSARLEAGALVVAWSDGSPDSRFDPAWLAAHDPARGYDGDDRVEPVLWDAARLSAPPTVDGARILTDDGALEAWLTDVARYGVGRLRGAPHAPGDVERILLRVGPIRDTNFGRVFDVRSKVDPDSAAYTSEALPGHTDLPTREYQPGLQALLCLENSATGGFGTMIDGFHLAERLRAEDPEAWRVLTTEPMIFRNRAKTSDYRWRAPAILRDAAGRYVEVRVGDFLRGPQAASRERIGPLYRGLRALSRLARDPRQRLEYAYSPGDLLLFDNRRMLHGRTAFDPRAGARWLQGVYVERDELHSRLRILRRARRVGAVSGERLGAG